MKQKILILAALLVLLVGCGVASSGATPKKAVEELFSKYQKLDSNVINQLKSVINTENLTDTQKSGYEDLMKKQYQNLGYVIKDEVINGDKAVVTVEIEVYDLAKTNKETEEYVTSHETEFLGDDNKVSEALYQDYKIARLKDTTAKIKYTIDLGLTKAKNLWTVDDLTDAERQKIHGLYSV